MSAKERSKIASEMGKLRMAAMTPDERIALARKGGKAAKRARRARSK